MRVGRRPLQAALGPERRCLPNTWTLFSEAALPLRRSCWLTSISGPHYAVRLARSEREVNTFQENI